MTAVDNGGKGTPPWQLGFAEVNRTTFPTYTCNSYFI